MGNYDDIIHLPHHVSDTRAQMTMNERAAQFAPFAALTGYESSITEAARETDSRIELDEMRKQELNETLLLLADRLPDRADAVFTYFCSDLSKPGGAYLTTAGKVRRIDSFEHELILEDGTVIPIDDIYDIELPDKR